MYNPKKYWEDRGKEYKGIEDDKEVKNMIDVITWIDAKDILDLGSGYGRVYSQLKESGYKNVRMCDFSDSMRRNCKKATGVMPDKWDGNKLPHKTNRFDLVILFDVLLHVPPKDIGSVIKECIRVGRHLFIATLTKRIKPAAHVFEHDYDDLFKKFNIEIMSERQYKREGNNGQFAMRKAWLLKR